MVCVKETKIKHNIGYIYSRKMQYLPIMRRGLSLAEYYIQNYTKYVGYKFYFFITFTLLILQASICVRAMSYNSIEGKKKERERNHV